MPPKKDGKRHSAKRAVTKKALSKVTTAKANKQQTTTQRLPSAASAKNNTRDGTKSKKVLEKASVAAVAKEKATKRSPTASKERAVSRKSVSKKELPVTESLEAQLNTAVDKGETDVVRSLVRERGANVNGIFQFYAPIHRAALKNHHALIEILVCELGAEVGIRAKTHDGLTALHYACIWGFKESIEVLVSPQCGADINCRGLLNGKTEGGNCPIHLALPHNGEMIRFLHGLGADLDARIGDDRTPAHLAAYLFNHDAIQALKELGADVTTKDCLGETPLDIVTRFKPKSQGACLDRIVACERILSGG